VSPAAAAAYTAGVEALLAHEAALKRGSVMMRCNPLPYWHACLRPPPKLLCCLALFAPQCLLQMAMLPFKVQQLRC
jgi:hypothetical protein